VLAFRDARERAAPGVRFPHAQEAPVARRSAFRRGTRVHAVLGCGRTASGNQVVGGRSQTAAVLVRMVGCQQAVPRHESSQPQLRRAAAGISPVGSRSVVNVMAMTSTVLVGGSYFDPQRC
jgi:hypothetical protein